MSRPAPKSKPAPQMALAPVMAPPRFPVWLIAVLLVLVTIALYWPVTGHDFIGYDDDHYVLDNTHVTSGLTLENARWAFRSGYASNWHPVTWLSHMLDCQMFGLNPWGHHLTNVLLHALNAALVFALLQQMTGATLRSLFVAALFAVHPLRVESVAWVAERKDVLCGTFGLLSLVFYARYARKSVISNQWPVIGGQASETAANYNTSRITHHASRFHPPSSLFYLLSLCCFALGLMSKPMLVTWPFVMLLLDYWPLRRLELSTPNAQRSTILRLVTEKVPFAVLALVTSVVAFMVQKQGGAVAEVEMLPLAARSGNALVSYCRYLAKLFWPTDLTLLYPHPGHWPLEKVLLAGGLLLGISLLMIVQWRRYPFLLMGWLWFCGTLVPVIGFVQVGDQAMADRYAYLPALGIFVALVWGLHGLAKGACYQQIGLSVAGAAAIVLCLALTRQQLGHWKDDEALFRHALAVMQNNYLAHKAFGDALDMKGQTDEAISQYREALRLKPDYADAHNNLGGALCKKGQIDEAISQYQEALSLKPDYPEARYNLATLLVGKGRLEEAIRHFQRVLSVKPDYAEAHNNLGATFYQQRRMGEAISQYQEALKLKPEYADARKNLEAALAARADSAKQRSASPNR